MPLTRLELVLSYTPNWILSPTRLPIPPQGRGLYIYSIFNFCRSLAVDGVYLTSPRTILNRSRRQSATRARIIYLFYFQLLPKLYGRWRLPHLSSNDTQSFSSAECHKGADYISILFSTSAEA